MVRLAICFGSACHLRGSYAVLEAFQGLFEKYKMKRSIDLEGAFCNGHCTEGVVIKTSATAGNVPVPEAVSVLSVRREIPQIKKKVMPKTNNDPKNKSSVKKRLTASSQGGRTRLLAFFLPLSGPRAC